MKGYVIYWYLLPFFINKFRYVPTAYLLCAARLTEKEGENTKIKRQQYVKYNKISFNKSRVSWTFTNLISWAYGRHVLSAQNCSQALFKLFHVILWQFAIENETEQVCHCFDNENFLVFNQLFFFSPRNFDSISLICNCTAEEERFCIFYQGGQYAKNNEILWFFKIFSL